MFLWCIRGCDQAGIPSQCRCLRGRTLRPHPLDTISSQVYISLMQQDRRSANHLRENYRIAFEVVQTKRHTTHKRYDLRWSSTVFPFETEELCSSKSFRPHPGAITSSSYGALKFILKVYLSVSPTYTSRRTPTLPYRVWEQKQDDITADSHDSTFASNRGEREVTRAGVKLDPR